MEYIQSIIDPYSIFMNLSWFGICMVLFSILATISPNINDQPLWRKDTATDAIYWLFMPLLYVKVSSLLVVFGLVVIFAGDTTTIETVSKLGYEPLNQLPLLLQVFLILLIQDFIMYWIHRGFHRSTLWKFHAIHHSSKEIDWLSTARFHPVNVILYSTFSAAVTFVMGFSPVAFAILIPFNILFSSLVHANLNWTFGPLRYVIASPVFHRWHHTFQDQGGDKNFAPTFPFLDLMFGTFYMPKGQLPERFGVDELVPKDFFGQLIYPFVKR